MLTDRWGRRESLELDLEALEFIVCRSGITFDAAYLVGHLCGNGSQKAFDLLLRAFDNHFYPPIRKIAYEAGDLEILGNSMGCETKTYPLDIAGVENLSTLIGARNHKTSIIMSGLSNSGIIKQGMRPLTLLRI